jgi:ATP-dependent NAD(P)H-hydrate dehydratase
MHEVCVRVIRAAREKGLPLVMDADALAIVQRDPATVKGYRQAVLTPNVVEFGRLAGTFAVDTDETGSARVEALARKLDGVTIVQKGGLDLISNGTTTLVVDLPGGKKRSGGQGDTLTGSIATFLAWRKAYLDGLWDTGGQISDQDSIGLAVFGGSAVTRVRSCRFFISYIREMLILDVGVLQARLRKERTLPPS